MKRESLPIDAFVDRIREQLGQARAAIVTADPGAGKTTRIPPALVSDGPVILLQPRRVAARAIAARIAAEQDWTLGREVGWQVRFERRFTADTKLLVVTEGILTARLQSDPLLSEFRTVIFDEFHERSIHTDLGIALAKQAWRARDDLRLLVMSATLDPGPISAFFDRCPAIEVPGSAYPTAIEYTPGRSVSDVAMEALSRGEGDVLCFLPGAAEIRRTVEEIEARIGHRAVDVLPLHGSLDAAAQDAVMRPGQRQRIVVSTNIAETSVTVPGVRAVVDSGWQKVARYDDQRAIDSLELERVTEDAARQRAGRASRVGPGLVCRVWDARDRLRPHQEPEIYRVDLLGPLVDIIAAGWDVHRFEWFEAPAPHAVERALGLLGRLGLVEGGKLTLVGEQARQIPLHPRLARAFIAANGSRDMARAAAILSERHVVPPRRAATTSDLLSALDEWDSTSPHVHRIARDIESVCARLFQPSVEGASRLTEREFLKAVLAGYPDRVAQRRPPGSSRVRLASGTGAVLAPECGVSTGEFLVALDVQLPASGGEARIRLASLVERDWLVPNASELQHRLDAAGVVKATLVERYDALVLSEQPTAPDPDVAATLLADAWLARGLQEDDERLLCRLRFAGVTFDIAGLVQRAALGTRSLADVRIANALPRDLTSRLEHDAPEAITVPSGRTVRLDYAADGSVAAAVKLQELFGLAETPTVGPKRERVVLALLAPNGRPVQLTRDLRSFWNRTYPEVRKELRGRYPKHSWPEDPWNAPPARGSRPRRR